jgi:hypothetical protein
VSGLFSEWQPKYAARGIATFPIGEAKKPSIRGWQKVGLRASTELADKFIDADALGYVTGRRSNVTVLDIDTTEEKIAEDAIRQHGQPAIITRTASGKFHHLTDTTASIGGFGPGPTCQSTCSATMATRSRPQARSLRGPTQSFTATLMI